MTDGKGKIPITFHIYKGDELIRSETITDDVIKIGTLESSRLRLDDESVSRMHAVVEVLGPTEIQLIDLGSAAGTFVNGKKINESSLNNGDEIVLGDTKISIEIGTPLDVEVPGDSALLSQEEKAPSAIRAVPPPVPPPAPAMPPTPSPFATPSPVAVPVAIPSPFAAPSQVLGGIRSPFAAAAPAAVRKETNPLLANEQVQYQIVPSGPPVNPAEIDTTEPAVEVIIMWGDYSVLYVTTLSPPRSFYVGDLTDAKGKATTDFLIGNDTIGVPSLPVVVTSGTVTSVVVPQGATGEVIVNDQRISFGDLAANQKLVPCSEMAGAQQYPMPPSSTARVSFKGFTFVVKSSSAARRIGIGGRPRIDWLGQVWTLLSAALVGLMLLMFYFLPPTASSLSLELLSADSRLVKYLIESPETVEEEAPEWLQEEKEEGKRAKDEEGQAGDPKAKKTNNRFGVEGPRNNPDPHLARAQQKEEAQTAGIIGLLRQNVGSWNSPTSPYGRETALGNDPMSALGALLGDQIGSNFGFGGLGLRGTGRGGGGTGEGTIGLGNIGTIGHGVGGSAAYGRGAGNFRDRNALVPNIRTGKADVRGSLSKEVIRRVIHRHINEVRFCYEQELSQRPDLEGRVSVKFIISPTGAVQTSVVDASTLNDAKVDSCIIQAVRRWTFPAPEGGGIVVVTYPFVLSQAGGSE